MNYRVGLAVALLCTVTGAFASGIGTWRSFTSMSEVRDVVRVGEHFWAATGGGLFSWDPANNSFETYTNAEGLLSNDLTATIADARGNVWTGGADGVVHVLLQDGSWTYILDISQAAQTSKRINRFELLGDSLFICTVFGLSLYTARDLLLGDTYTKFGSLSGVRVTVTDAAVFRDSIWAVVSDGLSTHRVAVAALANPNRLPPESWELRIVGSTTVHPKVLSVFQGVLYAGTTTGLYSLSDGLWLPVTGLQGVSVVSLDASGSQLLVCSPTSVYSLSAGGVVQQFAGLPSTGLAVTSDQTGSPVVGSVQGLQTLSGEWTSHAPNGPASNQFVSITVDLDGNVWSATGISGGGKGISRFNGSAWRSFTVANSNLPTNDYYKVSVGCTGNIWASSWGWGVLEIPRGAEAVDTSMIYGTNVGMVGIAADTDYVVVSDVVCDPNGNEWMSINSSGNGNIMAVRHGDGTTWMNQPLIVGASRVSTLWFNLPP